MPHPARVFLLSVSTSSAALFAGGVASAQVQTPPSSGDRVLGLDISAWQGNISQTTWNNIRNENRRFVFLRSSRGGTTGYYDQSDADNSNGLNTLSQRYDDPYYIQNITRATAAGILAGSYHFSRPNIVEGTLNSGGIRNNGTDEANHFIEMAGPWMRPGYLLPVHDLEAGISERTSNEMAQFAIDFSNRIYDVMGIRPAIYLSGQYAADLQASSLTLRNQVLATNPTLWSARWPAGSGNQYFGDVQNEHPKDTHTPIYGPWDDAGDTHPWTFWQYASGGRLQSFNNGNSNLDFNVAQGNIEFVKDQLVPAVWMNDGDGNWSTLSNWNSGQAPVAPEQGDGQVARVGALTLPTPRLPGQADPVNAGVSGQDDNVHLNRPNANITVTLSSGTHNIRRLNVNERLNVTDGGSINARLTGQVGAGGTLSLASGGSATFTEGYVNGGGVLEFNGGGTLNVGTLFAGPGGIVRFNGADGTGVIQGKAGVVNPTVNLLGGTGTFEVNDGAALTDLRIAIPLANGNLTKTGAGTLELTGNNSAYTGDLFVSAGNLRLTNANQIGTAGARTGISGSVLVDGNGLNVNRPIVVGGLGAGNAGALQNVSGNNTWSGNVVLGGTQNNQDQPGLNQISAASGTSLTLSGDIQNGAGGSWAKIGPGDVVLAGASPNTYTNLTRLFGGRIVVEKDGALGATNQTMAAASTLQRAGDSTAIAFRAPAGSPGLNYAAQEWIFTEGTGFNGVQIDNLGGANTFAGHFGLGGPVIDGAQQASFGVAAGSSLELTGGLHARTQVAAERRNIVKRGEGTLILSGTNGAGPTNSFARALADGSAFTIEAGTVQLKGTASNGENVVGVDTWKINIGATLALAQGGAAGNSDIAFDGGTLRPEQSMLAANSLTFGGNGTIDTAVAATFSGNVAGSGRLTKSGIGNAFLGGAVNAFAGGLNVTGGTLGIVANGTDSRIANVNGIAIAGSARFDLADNDLVVRTTPAASVEHLVANGYAGGAWNGAGGIVSSAAQGVHTLGVADNAELNLASFGGHDGLTGAETFVKYTYYGDADLTNFVDRPDFLRFRDGFFGLEAAAWLFGDFNYSGIVNGDDFALFMFGYRNQPGAIPPWTSFDDELLAFALDNNLDPALVPEPGSAALLTLAAGLLLRRQRRR
jgi:autotransporter-associated beta strand protein